MNQFCKVCIAHLDAKFARCEPYLTWLGGIGRQLSRHSGMDRRNPDCRDANNHQLRTEFSIPSTILCVRADARPNKNVKAGITKHGPQRALAGMRLPNYAPGDNHE